MNQSPFDISWGEKLRPFVIGFFPLGTLLLGYILEAVLDQYPLPSGQWMLLIVMCWAIFYPARLSGWLLIFFGVLADLKGGYPFGVSGLLFLLTYFLLILQRDYLETHPFVHIWVFLGLLLAGLMALKGLILFKAGGIVLFALLWKNWLVTTLAVPFFYIFLGRRIERWSHGNI